MERFTRDFVVFFLGVDLGIMWLLGIYSAYKFWQVDPLSAIFKIFAVFIALMIITRFIIIISRKICWPENREAYVPLYDSQPRRRKPTNMDMALKMQEKYKKPQT